MPIGKTSAQKPLAGACVNYGHPLANGLRHCIVFNEGGGGAVDLVSGRRGTLRGSTDWEIGPSGLAINPQGVDGSDMNFTEGAFVMPNQNISVFVKCAPTTVGTGNPTLGCINGAGLDAYAWKSGDPAAPHSYWVLTGVTELSSNNTLVAGSDLTLGFAYTRGVKCFFYESDSTQKAQVATISSASVPTTVTGSPSTIGSLHASTGTSFSGLIYCTYMWSRVLSQSEFEWLDAEPYAFIGRTKPISYSYSLLALQAIGIPAGTLSPQFVYYDTGQYSLGV